MLEEVAAGYGVAWWTVQDAVDAAVVELPEVDTVRVRHLGWMSTGSLVPGSSATTPVAGSGSSRG
jgi:hypothetical protein